MGDVAHDLGPAALAAHPLMQDDDDLITGVDELLRLEAKRVERLHIRVEQLLDPFLAVAGGVPVGRALAVADLELGGQALQDRLDPLSLNAS